MALPPFEVPAVLLEPAVLVLEPATPPDPSGDPEFDEPQPTAMIPATILPRAL
jgi:hypothetical protein